MSDIIEATDALFDEVETFTLEDLIGRTLEIEMSVHDGSRIIAAYDVETLEVFVLDITTIQ